MKKMVDPIAMDSMCWLASHHSKFDKFSKLKNLQPDFWEFLPHKCFSQSNHKHFAAANDNTNSPIQFSHRHMVIYPVILAFASLMVILTDSVPAITITPPLFQFPPFPS